MYSVGHYYTLETWDRKSIETTEYKLCYRPSDRAGVVQFLASVDAFERHALLDLGLHMHSDRT